MPSLISYRPVRSHEDEECFGNRLEEVGNFLHEKYLAQKLDVLPTVQSSIICLLLSFFFTKTDHAKKKNSTEDLGLMKTMSASEMDLKKVGDFLHEKYLAQKCDKLQTV